MVVDKFEVPRKQIISDLGGKYGAGQHPELAPGMDEAVTVPRCLTGLSRSVGLSIHGQLKAMTYAALEDLQDRAGGTAGARLSPAPPLGPPLGLKPRRGGRAEQRELALAFLFKTYRPRCTIYRFCTGRRGRWRRRGPSWSRRCGNEGTALSRSWTTRAAPPAPASWAGHRAWSWAPTTARWARGLGPPESPPHPAGPGLTGSFSHSKVPSVEKVLKALAGLPRSDFAEMIRQVGGGRGEAGWVQYGQAAPAELLSTPSFLAGQWHLQLHPGAGRGEDGAGYPG